MGYEYRCDGCGTRRDDPAPALMAQLSEYHYVSTTLGGELQSAGIELGDTVTICPDCTREMLVRGALE